MRPRILACSAALAALGCSTGSNDKSTGATAVDTDVPASIDSGDTGAISDSEPLDYTQPGPYPVGVASFDATVSSGTTPALVWYPAADSGEPFEYFPLITGTAVEGATARCTGTRPVIVHSHGSGSAAFEMAWLAEYLATHGIITVSLDHIGNTYYEETPDFARLYEQRPTDVAELFDLLLSDWAGPGQPLDGCIDASAGYTVTGYSFGGYTAYAVAGARVDDPFSEVSFDFSDPRANAVIGYAPWNGGGVLGDGMADITVPALTIGAARDETVARQYLPLHSALTTTPRILAAFPDAGHYTFIEWCNVYLFDNGCGDSFVDFATFKAEVALGTAAFMGYLSGDTNALSVLESDPDLVTWTIETE